MPSVAEKLKQQMAGRSQPDPPAAGQLIDLSAIGDIQAMQARLTQMEQQRQELLETMVQFLSMHDALQKRVHALENVLRKR